MSAVIGEYRFNSGAGSQLDRAVVFIRTGNNPTSIRAAVVALNAQGQFERVVSRIASENILFTNVTAMDKFRQRVSGYPSESFGNGDQMLRGIPIQQQMLVMQTLSPRGSREITVMNGNGMVPNELHISSLK